MTTPVTCPGCGHDIDMHDEANGCRPPGAYCMCTLAPSDIAVGLLVDAGQRGRTALTVTVAGLALPSPLTITVDVGPELPVAAVTYWADRIGQQLAAAVTEALTPQETP